MGLAVGEYMFLEMGKVDFMSIKGCGIRMARILRVYRFPRLRITMSKVDMPKDIMTTNERPKF